MKKEKKATQVLAYYTIASASTGAIPVPAASVAVIAEGGIMISHIESIYGLKITKLTILQSLGIIGSLNFIGRNVFTEGAKLLGWGTGNWWSVPLLSILGATTAGIQTYIIGKLAIEIAKNGGSVLDFDLASNIISSAKGEYDDFFKKWKKNPIPEPEFN